MIIASTKYDFCSIVFVHHFRFGKSAFLLYVEMHLK